MVGQFVCWPNALTLNTAVNGWIKCGADIHGHQRMNPYDLGSPLDPLTFYLVSATSTSSTLYHQKIPQNVALIVSLN